MKDIIERAIKNGYSFEGIRIDDTNHKRSNEVVYWPSWTSLKAPCFDDAYQYSLNDLLADEGFVKALFGDADVGGDWMAGIPNYKWHCRELSTIFDQDKKIEYIRRVMR